MYPRISIIMPSFNQAPYIEQTIQSILDQDYPNLEFIVLDGGSTDGSVEIIKHYSSNFKYWRSYPDEGQTASLIEGFKIATGDLLGWVNSDDIILPHVLDKVASTYLSDPDIGIIFGDYLLIDECDKILRCKRVPKNRIKWFANHGYWIFSSIGTFFTRHAYDLVDGLNPDLNYVMDADLLMRMVFEGVNYKHLGMYVGGFRRHKDAKTVSGRQDSRREYMRAAYKYWPSEYAKKRNQKRWKIAYWTYQIMNGNIRMLYDTVINRSKYWTEMKPNYKNNGDLQI